MPSNAPKPHSDSRLMALARRTGRLPFFASLRVRLLLLVWLALLPVFGLVIYNALQHRQLGIRAAEENALSIADITAREQDQLIESTRQLLVTMAALKVVLSNDVEACTAIFTNLVRQQPVYANVAATRPDGIVFASALPLEGEVDLSDRPYIIGAISNRAFYIGDYQTGRITRKFTFNMAYPALDMGGQLRAVVYAAADLAYTYNILTNAHLPPGSSLTVWGRDGRTLARYPDPGNKLVGEKIPLPPRPSRELMQRLRIRPTFPYKGRDGVWRLYAVKRLGQQEERPMFVSVGIPLASAYGPANQILFRNLVFLVAVSALALLAAWFFGNLFVLRQVRSLVGAARRLTHGELWVRSGIMPGSGELHQLASAFDEMAASLEARVEERRRAEAELKRLNEQLERRVAERTVDLQRSNEELEQFAFVASHDLQEPLRMITNYVQLIEKRYTSQMDSSGREFLAYVKEGSTRMQELVNDLLQFSRVGTKPKEFAPADCDKLVQHVLTNLKVAIEEAGAVVRVDPLPVVRGDPVQIGQLLQNLVGNALKFRPGDKQPSIHISARPGGPGGQPSYWEFSVSDNGIGIPPKDFERIFVIFQRLHTRSEYAGTGLGLALCKKIVERHGGRIWVESEPGQGAKFFFTLPAVTPA